METDIFRLAAVLYADNNYEVKPKTIHRKIIESVFIDNDNNILSIYNLIDEIERSYNIIFDYDEVYSIVTMNPNFNLSPNKTQDLNINLNGKRYLFLKEKIDNTKIEHYIISFHNINATMPLENLKKIIYEFLYEVFKINVTSFSKLIDSNTPIQEVININELNYNQIEIDIINSFLNWENNEKNIAIFNISNIALEYCLISNKKGNNFKLENLKNKNFYLDTNIIFRAIGINGEYRKNRVLTFLSKFKEAKESLFISKFTNEEVKSTIKYYVSTLNKKYSANINSNIFVKYSTNQDFLEFYHLWRKNRTNDSLELFEAFILSEIEKIKNKFDIKVDYIIPFEISDHKVGEIILDKASSLNNFKNSEKNHSNHIEAAIIDAKNIHLIEQKRVNQAYNIFECKYYLISSDQYLRKWDYTNNKNVPIVILPSQWMSLLLRYLNRTNDDFKSFVSFLNISSNEKLITNENLQLVLKGISEITVDFEYQNTIIQEMINSNFLGIIEKESSEDEIINNAKKFAKNSLEKELEGIKKENKKLENKFEKYQENTTQAIEDLQKQKDAEKLNKEKLEQENLSLKKEVIQTKILNEYNKYKSKAYIYMVIFLLCSIYFILTFFFTNETWNIIAISKNYINDLDENSIEREICKYTFLLPLSISIYSLIFIYKRMFNSEIKEKKMQELTEKYSKI